MKKCVCTHTNQAHRDCTVCLWKTNSVTSKFSAPPSINPGAALSLFTSLGSLKCHFYFFILRSASIALRRPLVPPSYRRERQVGRNRKEEREQKKDLTLGCRCQMLQAGCYSAGKPLGGLSCVIAFRT